MSLIGDLRTLLLANGTVSSRVGGSRIYSSRLPQSPTLPAIVISLIDDVPITALDYQHDCRPIVELKHFALTHKQAEDMDNETRAALKGYRGAMGAFSSVTILRVDSSDDLEPELDMAVRATEYQIWHN